MSPIIARWLHLKTFRKNVSHPDEDNTAHVSEQVLRPARPAELCAVTAGVVATFFGGGAQDLVRDGGVCAIAFSRLEGLFDSTIFT